MYSSNSHGVIDPDGHIVTPSECARLLNEAKRTLNELSQIIGTETPIGAFDLATTWRAERAQLQDEIEHLKVQIEGLNLAADQYSESRDRYVVYLASLADSAPALADRVLGGIAMESAIRAEMKSRICNLFLALRMTTL